MNASSAWSVASAVIVSVGGGAALVLSLSSWLGKVWAARILEQDRLRYTSELERFKNQLDQSTRRLQGQVDRTVFVGRLHFETEFRALSETWEKVAAVRSSMGLVRPTGDIVPADETPTQREVREVGRLRTFNDDANALRETVDRQSPFVPRDIYQRLDAAILIANAEASEVAVRRHEVRREDWYRRGREHDEQFKQVAEEISELIRARLERLAIIPGGAGQ